jgi:hypothetical protein
MSFDCGDGEGTQEKFDCNATVDFMCGGLAHDCPYQFDCTAEHIHWCTNKDDCDVAFTCRGGNDCKEDHKCNGNYSIAEPEDDTPGDFMCGYGKLPSENDQFACKSTFACESYDDFSCRKLATFNCGDGEGTDNFNCTNERFVCRTVFNCSEIQKVDCGDPDEYRPTGGATYNLQPPE